MASVRTGLYLLVVKDAGRRVCMGGSRPAQVRAAPSFHQSTAGLPVWPNKEKWAEGEGQRMGVVGETETAILTQTDWLLLFACGMKTLQTPTNLTISKSLRRGFTEGRRRCKPFKNTGLWSFSASLSEKQRVWNKGVSAFERKSSGFKVLKAADENSSSYCFITFMSFHISG